MQPPRLDRVDRDPCVICGGVHERCKHHARSRDPETGERTGEIRPCARWPVKGTEVCPSHGGSLPVVKAAGRRRIAARAMEADARAYMISTGEEGVPDIAGAMERLAAQALSMVEGAGRRVNALQSLRYGSDFGVEQTRAELQVLERSLVTAGKLLELCAKHQPDGEATAAVNLLTSLEQSIRELAE